MSNSDIEATDTTRDGKFLRLRFGHRTAVTSLQELPPAIERWNSILSAFSLVNRNTSPGARLLDIRGHTPLVVDLAVHSDVLAPLRMGIGGVLESRDELRALAGKIEELRHLKVKAEILKALEEQVRDNRQVVTARTAEKIKTLYGYDNGTHKRVHKAIMTLAQFIEDGGQIEFANASSDATCTSPDQIGHLSAVS